MFKIIIKNPEMMTFILLLSFGTFLPFIVSAYILEGGETITNQAAWVQICITLLMGTSLWLFSWVNSFLNINLIKRKLNKAQREKLNKIENKIIGSFLSSGSISVFMLFFSWMLGFEFTTFLYCVFIFVFLRIIITPLDRLVTRKIMKQ